MGFYFPRLSDKYSDSGIIRSEKSRSKSFRNGIDKVHFLNENKRNILSRLTFFRANKRKRVLETTSSPI